MPIPSRIQDAMNDEGVDIEDVANEIDGTDVPEAILGEDADVEEDVQTDDQEVAPVDDEEDQSEDAEEEASSDEDEAEEEQAADSGVNLFDVGLTPEQLSAADAPKQAPTSEDTTPASPAPAPASTPTTDAPEAINVLDYFTPQEVATLGGEAQATIVARALRRQQEAMTSSMTSALNDSNAAAQQARQAALNGFRENIANSVENYDQVIQSKAWQIYLNSPNPFSGGTMKDALIAADAAMDRSKVIAVFDDFKSKYGQARPNTVKAKTKKSTLGSLATPSPAASSGRPSRAKGKYKFKESFIDNLDAQRRSKEITYAEYLEQVQAYETALEAGQVQLGK